MTKAVLKFFAIGAVLLAGKLAWAKFEKPDAIELTVTVGESDADARINQAIENEILLDQAKRMNWHVTDPVARQHMLKNMKFTYGDKAKDKDDLSLVSEAIEMGMPDTDPVVRARLVQRARLSLQAVYDDQKPTEQELEAFREANPDEFMRQEVVTFAHVFLSGDKRGESLMGDARATLSKLQAMPQATPNETFALGDPLLRARPLETRSKIQAVASYGTEFAESLLKAPLNQWVGPLESVFGAHLVKITERREATLPALEQISNQVRGAFLRELRDENFANRYQRIADLYNVTVVRAKN